MEKDENNGVEWRQKIQVELADLKIYWLDPTNKPTTIGFETEETKRLLFNLRQQGNYDEVKKIMKTIRCVDLRMTDISDFLIVNFDSSIPTAGTHEEISNANRQKKPILVHMMDGKQNTPLWLLAMLPHQLIFSTWDELYSYLRHIAHDDSINRLNRWYFFNFHLTNEEKDEFHTN